MTIRFSLMMPVIALVLALSGAILGPARAEDGEQIKLTTAQIDHFLASHDELKALSEDFAKKYGDRAEAGDDDPVLSLAAYLMVPEAATRLTEVLKRYQFSSLSEWQQVMTSIVLALPYANTANPPPNLDTEMARAKGEIEADKTLSDEQRKQALAQLQEQYEEAKESVPLPENIETLKPYAAKLTTLLANDNKGEGEGEGEDGPDQDGGGGGEDAAPQQPQQQ